MFKEGLHYFGSFCVNNGTHCLLLFVRYRKIPTISAGLIFVQKTFLVGLFSEGLIIGGNFAFQIALDLTIKQLKTRR